MSILNSTVNPADFAAKAILDNIKQEFTGLVRAGQQAWKAIWQNPNATPQQVLASLGTSAQAVFGMAQLNIQTINAAATIGGITPPVMPSIPNGWTVTFAQDGSATANYTAPQTSSSSSSS